MAIVQVKDATGSVLDWMVAKCENTLGRYVQPNEKRGTTKWKVVPQTLRYSTNWVHVGPIIEREKIELVPSVDGKYWYAESLDRKARTEMQPTPLIAAMRCYVASKLGNTVEVPDELI